jgi:phage-related minor tail protein
MESLARVGDQFASKLVGAFEAVVIRGKALDDVFRSLALSLSEMALKAAFKPFEDALGSFLGGAFAGLPQLFTAAGSAGPVDLFGGGLGTGAGMLASAAAPIAPAVTFNIQTPDVASFQRSQGQIAAMLHRTVESGRRHL